MWDLSPCLSFLVVFGSGPWSHCRVVVLVVRREALWKSERILGREEIVSFFDVSLTRLYSTEYSLDLGVPQMSS